MMAIALMSGEVSFERALIDRFECLPLLLKAGEDNLQRFQLQIAVGRRHSVPAR